MAPFYCNPASSARASVWKLSPTGARSGYAFQHRRLHEVPLTGGGSSLRVSEAVEPELLDASKQLLGTIGWHGVAMVEFKWQPASRTYNLMEINGRFWGSLPLATAAGANFPAMLAELHLRGKVTDRDAYRNGVYCRNLARDVYWHELVLRSRGDASVANPRAGRYSGILGSDADTAPPLRHPELARPLAGSRRHPAHRRQLLAQRPDRHQREVVHKTAAHAMEHGRRRCQTPRGGQRSVRVLRQYQSQCTGRGSIQAARLGSASRQCARQACTGKPGGPWTRRCGRLFHPLWRRGHHQPQR